MADFIGNVPYRGKLNSIKTNDNSFIGEMSIKQISIELDEQTVDTKEIGDLRFMYFRDYVVDPVTNEVIFQDMDIKDEDYYFDISFIRIPSELKYQAIKENSEGGISFIDLGNSNMYFGLCLLNIHTVIPERSTVSIARKTHIRPNRHYKRDDNTDNIAVSIAGNPFNRSGGKHGCRKIASFGIDKLPVFRWVPSTANPRIDEITTPTYLAMQFGTDNHISFCEAITEDKIKELIQFARTGVPDVPGKKLGISLTYPEYYATNGFKNDYGIHVVSNHEGGWEEGFYKIVSY